MVFVVVVQLDKLSALVHVQSDHKGQSTCINMCLGLSNSSSQDEIPHNLDEHVQ